MLIRIANPRCNLFAPGVSGLAAGFANNSRGVLKHFFLVFPKVGCGQVEAL